MMLSKQELVSRFLECPQQPGHRNTAYRKRLEADLKIGVGKYSRFRIRVGYFSSSITIRVENCYSEVSENFTFSVYAKLLGGLILNNSGARLPGIFWGLSIYVLSKKFTRSVKITCPASMPGRIWLHCIAHLVVWRAYEANKRSSHPFTGVLTPVIRIEGFWCLRATRSENRARMAPSVDGQTQVFV